MANNIQIIGNIINTDTVSRYSSDDVRLIGSQEIQNYFDPNSDYVEYYVYDIGGTLLGINYSYNGFKLPTDAALTPSYTPPPNSQNQITDANVGVLNSTPPDTGSSYASIEIDPVNDLQQLGYSSGEFKVQYNFFKNKVGSPNNEYFLKRISSDRTEISITSTALTNIQIEQDANNLINELNASPYFINYLVNFGLNQQYVTVNVALDKIDSGYEILFKLYEPLPNDIVEKTSLWVVEEKVSPYVFDLNLDVLITPPAPLMLRGANFTIPIAREINTVSTQYGTYNNIVTSLQTSQNNTYQKLLNTLTSSSIAINVNYTDYNNFVFFGSIKQRINNFYSKIKEIEDYNTLITTYSTSASFNPSLQLEINKYTSSINTIISNFDGYETYLYFESSSYTWPKSTSTLPYTLYSTGSLSGSLWFAANTESASLYDELNQNNLQNGIPTFLVDNPDNDQYLLFLNMIGQYFDNIWIMLKSVTDINLANNNLNEGISKDLVYHVLKSFGIDLYNSSEGDSLNQYLVGNNTGSAYISGSLTDFSPTSSYLNNIPKGDLVAEVYKRLYHNLPLLVKTKGTTAGLQNIVTMFGVTSSILSVKEYGGESKAEYLKGYSTNKVRLGSVNPLENVLSPITSIQQITTASADYLDNDLQYVDISFSPQNQIDLYVSQSISSSNPSFDLDEYIGDPRQQYLTTYPNLDNQRKIYFEQGTGSYSGFTSSYLDYNGFIRLIQFFDNSLFKTLEAFVPARASLSTGITFNSPVLERNKFAYANPTNSTTESIKEGEITSGSIGSEYGFLYDNLSGDKAPYYSGEISGSEINIYDTYFIPNNENPYLGDINVWNSQHDADEQISLNQFALSDYNVLFNNVSSSRLSANRKILENPGSPDILLEYKTGSITSSAELQDSYLSLSSYKDSRHDGIKIKSATYNQYTAGDSGSYGKTSAIDKYQAYFLTFSEIRSAYPELVGKSTLWINSLVDKDSSQLTVNISTSSNYYNNLIDNFGKDSNVNLQITSLPTGSSQTDLDQSTTVYRPALLWPSVILTNESGSTQFDNGNTIFQTASLAFQPFNRILQVASAQVGHKGGIDIPTSPISSFYYPTLDNLATGRSFSPINWISGSISGTNNFYIEIPYGIDINSPFSISSRFTIRKNTSFEVNASIELVIERILSTGLELFTSASTVQTVPTGAPSLEQNVTGSFGSYLLLPGDKIYVRIAQFSGGFIGGTFQTGVSSTLLNLSPANIVPDLPIVPSDCWSTGSDSSNILTSSISLYNIYGLNYLQDNVSASLVGGIKGYSPITERLLIQLGDEIRFNQNESLSYNIISADSSLLRRKVFVYLNSNVASTFTVSGSGFLIRRNTLDPSKLVINAPKLIGGAPGYLTPEYMTPELATNLDGVVETLKETGIL